MKIHKVNDWTWRLNSRDALDGWFDNVDEISRLNRIKANSERVVFTADSPLGPLYVKYDRPSRFSARVKNKLSPKVKSEFQSSELLRKHGIPVVDYLGWGTKGSEGMLISRAFRGGVGARDFWYGEAAYKKAEKEAFLSNFANFLCDFLSKPLIHPDFHLGNLMYTPHNGQFTLLDPYGVKEEKNPRFSQIFAMRRIIGALRGELSDSEAKSLILSSKMAENESAASQLWEQILVAETEEMFKLWEKRKEQILSNNPKYCVEHQDEASTVLVRLDMRGKPLVDLENPSKSAQKSIELPENEARKLWIDSFHLQFHRIPHRRVVLWRRNENNDQENELFFEKNETIASGLTDEFEFEHRCALADIPCENAMIGQDRQRWLELSDQHMR